MPIDTDIIKFVEQIMGNSFLAVLVAVWAVGWVLKNQTLLDNKYIPLVLALLGTVLGVLLIEMSITGGIAGLALAVFAIGGHSSAKNLFNKDKD